jgi:hypothetical protein
MKLKIIIGVTAVVVVAILLFGYVIPYGIKGDSPGATVKVYIKDITAGEDTLTASVDIGQPSNTLAFKRPDIQFRPLTAFEQTLSVNATHQYVIWLDLTFDYAGERIASYDQVVVTILAKSGDNRLLTSAMLAQAGVPIAGARDAHNFTLTISGPLPVGTPPFEYGMGSDPFLGANTVVSKKDGNYKVICGAPQTALWEPGFAWLPDKLIRPAAIGIEGITIDCTVTIYGTASDGTPVVGAVTATLVLHADLGTSTPSGGAISVSIKDMSAGVREGAW